MQKLSEERVKAASDLAETEQQLIKLADRFERLLVRAPSNGIVQELTPKSIGEVVKAGDPVARIVPTARELVAEVRIDPKDSGHIQSDADAEIRLLTFDSAIFGSVRGKVIGVYGVAAQGLRFGSGITVGLFGAVVGVHWSLGLSAAALCVGTTIAAIPARRHARA